MKQFNLNSLCLTFCLLMSMNAIGQTVTIVTIDGLKYQLNGTEAYVDGYSGSPGDLVIPETIESDGLTFRVTKINQSAFSGCSGITSLTSKFVTSIGAYAFSNCTNLQEVILKCTSIGQDAFQNCTSLQKATLDVSTIEHDAFSGCSSLEKLDLGYRLERMDYKAFYNCSKLSYVIIPGTCIYHKSSSKHDIYRERTDAPYTPSGNDGYTYEIGFGPYWTSDYYRNDFSSSYEYNNAFSGCNRLQAIVYLGRQNSNCGSNAKVYHNYAENVGVSHLLQWNATGFTYTGSAPTSSYTCDLPFGFQPNAQTLPTLEKDAGTYSTTIPVTFSNGDVEFSANVPYTYTINPVALTAHVKDATKVYGDPNPQFESEYSGFVTGEDESVISNHGTYTTSANISSGVGSYAITQSGATAQNYTFTYEPGTLTVTKAPLTITARNKTMDYGSKVPTLEVDYAGLKNNESKPTWITEPIIATTASATSDAGTYPITISGGEAKNYNVTVNPGTMTIKKVALTATTQNATREYGDENPDFILSYSGLKNNETAPAWTVEPSFTTPATKTSPVGTYYINAAGGEAKNYYVEYVNNGKLTVTKAPLTATARSMSKLQGEANPTFIIDYEGFKNGETAIALTEEPIATTTATLYSRPGTYPINVSGGSAINYDFTYVNGTLTVLPKDEPGDPTDNMLTLSSVSGNKGTQMILPIGLTNQKEITGFQFDLYLPAGVTVATNSKGKMIIETTERMDGNYTVSGNQRDGFVRIVGYSADGDAFTGNSGDILNVTLNIDENMADGDYTVRLKDIVLSDVNNTEYHPADVGATLTVKSYVLGDVDNSGAININDVVCIINYILGKTVNNFIAEAADVDGSGAININDVVTIINRYILMKTSAPAMFAENASRRAASVDENFLHLDDITINPGETKEVKMLMTNTGLVAAIQGKLMLPAGLSIVKKSNGRVDAQNINARSEDFTLSTNVLDDGSLTFAQYSADGFTYEGNEGGIFTFKIKADENATAGTYSLTLSNVVLSIDGVGYDIPDRMSSLTVTGTSGIGLTPDSSPTGEGNYYTLDGQKLNGKPTQKGVYIQNGKKIIVK